MASKKGGKSKFLTENLKDLLNDSEFIKDTNYNDIKIKKKRQAAIASDITDEVGISNLIGQNEANWKKKKLEVDVEACKESRQKVLYVMSQQQEARKEGSDNLLKNFSEVMLHLEADCNAVKDNENKIEDLTGTVVKCMNQATLAHKRKLTTLREIYSSFMKQCDDMESDHKAESDKLAEEIEEDIYKLQQKWISETKRSGWETLRNTIFNAMQDDF